MKRIVLAIVLALGVWSAKLTLESRARERAEAEARAQAELDISDMVAAQAGAEDGVVPSGPEAVAADGAAPVPEEINDPVVHCVVGDEGTFVRESDCLAGGGEVDEPSWSRLD